MLLAWFQKYVINRLFFKMGVADMWMPDAGRRFRFVVWLKPARLVLVCLVFVACLMPSCTEIIDLELDSTTRRLVVEGVITSEQKMHYIRLTESVPFFQDSASPSVSGADVMITDGVRVEYLSESTEMPGFYLTSGNFEGIPERTYILTVSGIDVNDDGEAETYTASSYMPPVGRPDSIEMVYDSGWEIWKVLLYAKENPDTEDYYLFRIFADGGLISDNMSEYSVVSDQFFDGGCANGTWVQSIDAMSEANQLEEGSIITLQMGGITRDYYKFIEGVQREKRRQLPLFSGPPANAPGNVSGGALGFFSAFSASYVSVRFTGEKL